MEKKITVAIIGASGFVGKNVTKTALELGYEVLAISRSGTFPVHPALKVINIDVKDKTMMIKSLQGVDLIISTFNSGWDNPNKYEDYMNGYNSIIEVAKALGKRLVITGGASSLYDSKTGHQFYEGMDNNFKKMVQDAYDLRIKIMNDFSFDWTYVSPALNIIDEQVSKEYNVGGDFALTNNKGESQISVRDLAMFLLTTAAHPINKHKRVTLGEK